MPLCAPSVRLYPVVIMGNPKKSKDLPSVKTPSKNEWGLTAQQEAFCHAYLEENNASVAYRRSYNVGRNTLPQTVWQEASHMMAEPTVASRIEGLRKLAELETICGIRQLMQDWLDISTADVSEIIRLEKWNCRHCHGDDFKYQWIDDAEWAQTCAKLIDAAGEEGKPPRLPAFDGGVGFKRNGDPNTLCPYCCGQGETRTIVSDTTKLSTKARKLFKNIKETRYGEIVVELECKQKARESIARMLGAFNDKLMIPGLHGAGKSKPEEIPATASTEEASRIYQKLVAAG